MKKIHLTLRQTVATWQRAARKNVQPLAELAPPHRRTRRTFSLANGRQLEQQTVHPELIHSKIFQRQG
jgi:hypothetical protein